MTRWLFKLRDNIPGAVDASSVRRTTLQGRTDQQLSQLPLTVDGSVVPLAEVFEVSRAESDGDRVEFHGDLRHVHGLGAGHDEGELHVEGDVGHHFAAGATGGRIVLNGNAGDYLGAPLRGRRTGLRGATVFVSGDAGAYAGHRMRRGDLVISGNVGDALAASMIAGTIVVGGRVGREFGFSMKRGTLLFVGDAGLESRLESDERFSQPLPFVATFLRLYRDPRLVSEIQPLLEAKTLRARGDLSVQGLGEVICS